MKCSGSVRLSSREKFCFSFSFPKKERGRDNEREMFNMKLIHCCNVMKEKNTIKNEFVEEMNLALFADEMLKW